MADEQQETERGWMSDVQRALAMILIGSFAFVAIFSTVCSVLWPEATALTDMAKSLQSNLTNMCLIGLGFFFGSNMSKMLDDAGKQKIVEKLTSPSGPVVPAAASVVVVSWWSLLKPEEQAAIEAAASTDARVATILTAFKSGKAEVPDLTDLVVKGLLTQARADEINPK